MFIKGVDSYGAEVIINTNYIVSLENVDVEDHKDQYFVRLLGRSQLGLKNIYLKKKDVEDYVINQLTKEEQYRWGLLTNGQEEIFHATT